MTEFECGKLYTELCSESKYEEAISLIDSLYANKDKDYWYFYLIAGAQYRSAMENRTSELLPKASEYAEQAQKIAPEEERNDVVNLLELIGSGKEIISLLINWDATQERIGECIEAEHYQEAIDALNSHYAEFENGEFDIDFWNTKFDILTKKLMHSGEDSDLVSEIEACISEAKALDENIGIRAASMEAYWNAFINSDENVFNRKYIIQVYGNLISDLFKDLSKKYELNTLDNNNDLIVIPNINETKQVLARRFFRIDLEECILYIRDTSFWNNTNEGVVITNRAIYWINDNDNPKNREVIEWSDFNNIEYKEKVVYFDRPSETLGIGLGNFLKDIDSDSTASVAKRLCRMFNEIAQAYRRITDSYNQGIADRFDNFVTNHHIAEAIEFGDAYNQAHSRFRFAYQIAELYLENGEQNKALEVIEDVLEHSENDSFKLAFQKLKYKILHAQGSLNLARQKSWEVLEKCEDKQERQAVRSDFDEIDSEFINRFLEQPYTSRRMLVCIDDYGELTQKTLSVFRLNQLPAIKFQTGHPLPGILYVGHPFLTDKYVPFDNYELDFIEDKIREFCQIAQYLGATEINIECVNTSNGEQERKTAEDATTSANVKIVSGDASYSGNKSNQFMQAISKSINLHQVFTPKRHPELPKNLVWFQGEPSWQRLYEQRMQGSLLEHEERIETKKIQVIHNSELQNIAAELKCLWNKANAKWDSSMDEKFKVHEDAVLAIHIKFAPLESLESEPVIELHESTNSDKPSCLHLTSSEQEYYNELTTCFEISDSISDGERRLLNRLSRVLGLSEERAKELEEIANPNTLSKQEKEYAEEIKLCLDNGTISANERRLLNRIRVSLDIPEDRAVYIESLYANKYLKHD